MMKERDSGNGQWSPAFLYSILMYVVAGSDTLSSQSLAQELLDSGSSSSGAPAGVKGMGQPAREVLDGVKQGFNAQDGPCNPVKEVHVTPYENP